MTTTPNPYAPPQIDEASLPPAATSAEPARKKSKKKRKREPDEPVTCWRHGDVAVTHMTDARLPKRCVACAAPGTRCVVKRLSWHEPWFYLTIAFGCLIYVILMFIVRKTTNVEYWLCDAHHAEVRRRNLIAAVGVAAGVVLVVVAGQSVALFALGAMALLGALVVLVFYGRTLSVAEMTDHFARFRVGKPFLETLPPWQRDEE